MMRPRLVVELKDEQISWAGLKHFHCEFLSGFTTIYGENYAFLSLFTKALPTDGRTDTASYKDARTHLKTRQIGQRCVLSSAFCVCVHAFVRLLN